MIFYGCEESPGVIFYGCEFDNGSPVSGGEGCASVISSQLQEQNIESLKH